MEDGAVCRLAWGPDGLREHLRVTGRRTLCGAQEPRRSPEMSGVRAAETVSPESVGLLRQSVHGFEGWRQWV